MRLTRSQLRNDLRTLEAQHHADVAVIARLSVEAHRLPQVAAANVSLARQLERAELEVAQLRAILDFQDVRLTHFMAEHPDIFDADQWSR